MEATIEQAKEVLEIINEIDKAIIIAKGNLESINKLYIKEDNKVDKTTFIKLIQLKYLKEFIETQRTLFVIPSLIEAIEHNRTSQEDDFFNAYFFKTFMLKDFYNFFEVDEEKRVEYIIDKCNLFPFEHDEEFIEMKNKNWRLI